jgi:hypothetical protein
MEVQTLTYYLMERWYGSAYTVLATDETWEQLGMINERVKSIRYDTHAGMHFLQ